VWRAKCNYAKVCAPGTRRQRALASRVREHKLLRTSFCRSGPEERDGRSYANRSRDRNKYAHDERGREREGGQPSRGIPHSRDGFKSHRPLVSRPAASDGQTQFSFDCFMLPLGEGSSSDNASVHARVIALLSPRARQERAAVLAKRSKPRKIPSRATHFAARGYAYARS